MNALNIDQAKSLMITGGRQITPELCYLAHLIGYEAIVGSYNLVSNGAEGVDSAAAEGALMACLLLDFEPLKRIKVFRPVSAPTPAFDFGHLRIAGEDFGQRRDFAIRHSDAVVIIGGGNGTQEVARRTRDFGKPLIPVGIGHSTEASVLIWHECLKAVDSGEDKSLSEDDLLCIGPSQYDLRAAAKGVVAVCHRLLEQNQDSVIKG